MLHGVPPAVASDLLAEDSFRSACSSLEGDAGRCNSMSHKPGFEADGLCAAYIAWDTCVEMTLTAARG